MLLIPELPQAERIRYDIDLCRNGHIPALFCTRDSARSVRYTVVGGKPRVYPALCACRMADVPLHHEKGRQKIRNALITSGC